MTAERELEQQLKETGNKLLVPPSSVDELLSLLDHAEYFLSRVEQSPAKSMQDAFSSLTQALAAVELLRHSNVDVKVAVASCISEITRITAPDAPYADDKMKDVFQLIVSSFENLPDKSSRSYNKRVLILETVAKVRSCVVMLDLECDGLIVEMLQLFLSTIREYHSESIFLSMETIMTLVLEESEDISPEILAPLLASVKKDNKEVLPIAVKLAEKVFQNCAVKLKPYLSQVIKSLDAAIDDYSNIIASISRGDSAVNHNDENISNEPAVMEDNSAVTSTDEAQETQAAEDIKNAFKEDDANPEVHLTSMTILTNGVDGSGNQKDATSTKGESSVNADEQIVDGQTSADKVAFKPEVDDLEAEKSPRLESKPENATKKKARKSNISTISESSDAAHVADEKEVGGCPDQENGNNVEALDGPVEDDKAVQASTPMEVTVENLPAPKALDAEAVRITSPSRSGTLADEIRKKRTGRPKKKEKLVKEDFNLKNATEGTKESDAKPNKLKRASADSVNEVKVSADVETPKSGGGGTSDSGIKARTEIDNKADEFSNANVTPSQKKRSGRNRVRDKVASADVGASKSGGGGTSDSGVKARTKIDNKAEDGSNVDDVKGGRNRGRDKAASEDEKTESDTKDDTKMIHTPRSPAKSAKDEGFQDEIVGTSNKRKRSSAKDKEKVSEILDHAENLVGVKVKVYWPKDFVFYEGVIESFDPIKKKHKIKYNDGDVEVLNLRRERWEFIEDSVSSKEKASEPANEDDTPEMQKRKKSKTTPELSAKGGSLSSGKSKAGVLKSGGKSKEEGNDPKLKDKSSKPATKSEDNTSMKSRENDGTAPRTKSKQESQKVADKSKQDNPKIGSKSKGKTTQGGGDPSSNGSGKARHSSLKSKETGDSSKENRKEKSSYFTKTPEGTKAKLSESKAQESDTVSSKKRRR